VLSLFCVVTTGKSRSVPDPSWRRRKGEGIPSSSSFRRGKNALAKKGSSGGKGRERGLNCQGDSEFFRLKYDLWGEVRSRIVKERGEIRFERGGTRGGMCGDNRIQFEGGGERGVPGPLRAE